MEGSSHGRFHDDLESGSRCRRQDSSSGKTTNDEKIIPRIHTSARIRRINTAFSALLLRRRVRSVVAVATCVGGAGGETESLENIRLLREQKSARRLQASIAYCHLDDGVHE